MACMRQLRFVDEDLRLLFVGQACPATLVCVCVCMCVCVRACVRACVHPCVSACVRAIVRICNRRSSPAWIRNMSRMCTDLIYSDYELRV